MWLFNSQLQNISVHINLWSPTRTQWERDGNVCASAWLWQIVLGVCWKRPCVTFPLGKKLTEHFTFRQWPLAEDKTFMQPTVWFTHEKKKMKKKKNGRGTNIKYRFPSNCFILVLFSLSCLLIGSAGSAPRFRSVSFVNLLIWLVLPFQMLLLTVCLVS